MACGTVRVALSLDDTVDADELAAALVADLLRVEVREVRTGRLCPRCGSDAHGRPVVLRPRGHGVHVSLSRTSGCVAAAASTAGPVGVDVERVDRTAFAGFAYVAGGSLEHAGPDARAVGWTRTEALAKATGRGLAATHESAAHGPAWVTDLVVGQGLAGAVAVLAQDEPQVRTQQVRPAAAASRAGTATRRPTTPTPSPTAAPSA